MKEKKAWRRFCIGAVMFAASFLLLALAGHVPGAAQWYAVHCYPAIVGTVGRLFGRLPFSAAELWLYLTAALLAGSLLRLVVRLIRKRAGKGEAALYASGVWLFAAVLFLLYTVNCGMNYHRTSFAESSGIRADSYTLQELTAACETLTENVNTYAPQVARDNDGVMELQGDESAMAVRAMEKLGETRGELKGYYPRPKKLIFSEFLSVQSLTGIYAPFTVEANYNGDMTAYNIPFTACHELSHLRGFMQEEEANFIAWLACMGSGEAELCYSGSMLGWINCMNVLYDADREEWSRVRGTLSEEAEADLRANSDFWARWEGAVSEVQETVNDHYLRANGQEEGIESYDRMADLIVAYYKKTLQN